MRFICRQGNLNDCGRGVKYVDFTGSVEFFEVRLNDDGWNPQCIKSLSKVCLARTVRPTRKKKCGLIFCLLVNSGRALQYAALCHCSHPTPFATPLVPTVAIFVEYLGKALYGKFPLWQRYL